MGIKDIQKEVLTHKNPEKARFLQRFFKTGKGEYAEGDIFYGIIVPVQRKIALKYSDLSLSEVKNLLKSNVHEERLIALLILVHKFEHGKESDQKDIYDLYLKSTQYINNWDLVDLSAAKIVGAYLQDKPRLILQNLATSQMLWERRIAMIATYCFIRNNQFEDTLLIAKILINDKHDLIQKAVGWMLREVGKRDEVVEKDFLKRYYKTMPRTALRYAIEKFPEQIRKAYLNGEI